MKTASLQHTAKATPRFICPHFISIAFFSLFILGGCALKNINITMNPATSVSISDQGYFFVGGEYVTNKKAQTIRIGQMFVQYQIPVNRKHPYPVVMWHGGGQTGTNFLGTPDGREGWAQDFLKAGYAVYVVDQPGRARSGYFPEFYGSTRQPNAQAMSERFTAPELKKQYPQAHLHTQWPGSGVQGDTVFDQFFSSQVEDIENLDLIEKLNRKAGAALLDKIGPAILLTHSQSGPFGWLLGNDHPAKVKGILSIEPSGPPYKENELSAAPDWFKDGAAGKIYGVTRTALDYAPALADKETLTFIRQERPDKPQLTRCWMQAEPARKLPNLKNIPILMLTSESSYHAPYDHCTAKFLTQAGVKVEHLRLNEVGIRGNGHMMMLEKNNQEIATLLIQWLNDHIH